MISRFNSVTQANIKAQPLKNNVNDPKKHNKNTSFKGPIDFAVQGGTQALNYLNMSPAIGACFVDFSSMVFPRTMVDFSRSKDAGMETGFRESSGTINHALAGVVGLGAGYAVSAGFNKANGVKSHLIFANNDTLDVLSKFVKNSETTSGYNIDKYWRTFFESLEGLNTTSGGEPWKTLSDQSIEKAVGIMKEAGTKTYKVQKKALAQTKELIQGELGAGSTFRLSIPSSDGRVNTRLMTKVEGSFEELFGSANSMMKAVVDKLDKIRKTNSNAVVVDELEKFVAGIKNRKAATVVAGLAIPVAIGMSAQPLNRYLTKKRTGSDGFVGVEGREPDYSKGFKATKILLGLAMGSAMVSTILKNPLELYTNIKRAAPEILSKLQYKGAVPTMDQFKFIYGLTIMSRIFSARDKNEVRESSIKDSLGFANWLILGGFVSKLAAKAFDKGIVNYDKNIHGKGLWNYITKSVEKTHEEILYPALKKMESLGLSTVDENGKSIPFRKLMKMMAQNTKGTEYEALAKETASKLKYKNYAQLLGYIYSGIVLGVGIPKLNIAITKHYEKKAAAKKALNSPGEKMRVNNEFIKMSQRDSKTFGAFLEQM